jgi:hypothetical protein
MVLFSCFLYIFQMLSLGPIIGWVHGPMCLTHETHPVIAALSAYNIYYHPIREVIIKTYIAIYNEKMLTK